jgi:glucose/arabinose dehydrogenase
MTRSHLIPQLLLFAAVTFAARVSAAPPQEENYYQVISITPPAGEVIEAGGIEMLPDGRVAVCTRRGQVWIVENASSHPAKPARWTLFAEGLHEPLSIAWRDGWIYVVQRPEVTRLRDENGDGRADLYETVSDGWGISGNYHEYTFGSPFDKEGNLWCATCLTGSFSGEALYRGWILRISADGKFIPTASGVRSPGGVGFNAKGDVFFTDNQGTWNGSSSLKWAKPGSFQGNPNGNIYYAYAKGAAGNRPADPPYSENGSRMVKERAKIPELLPPAVMLPHKKLGQSPTGIVTDLSGGRFGPFPDQLFVGDQTHSKITRIFLEQVNGIYQGAAIPFLKGFKSGLIGLRLSNEGALFASGTDRGWGARGGSTYSFERVNWTGKTPFDIHEMRVLSDGFKLTFTSPVNMASAVDASFRMEAYTYSYGKAYGSPELDPVTPKVTVSSVAADGLSLKLKVEPMTKGHVHELHSDGLRTSAGGHALLHPEAYYTLNEIPN